MSSEAFVAGAVLLGVAIIFAAFAIGTTIGDGIVASKAVEAIARQPEARPNIFTFLFLGVGLVEAGGFIAIGLAFYLMLGVARVGDLIPHAAK